MAALSPDRIWTVGHSTRELEAFIELLLLHDIRTLADVRRYPTSRRYPHFNSTSLSASLARHHIVYRHVPSLGGRRDPAPDSTNTGWRNDQFRGYADYMRTPEFAAAVDDLISVARTSTTAIMCAEAVPWRCHRQLIADALLARGWQVQDIFDETSTRPHAMTPFAIVNGEVLTYPTSAKTGQMNLFDSDDQS